jgi:hypothetical protein
VIDSTLDEVATDSASLVTQSHGAVHAKRDLSVERLDSIIERWLRVTLGFAKILSDLC